jgi:hypothetical protein
MQRYHAAKPCLRSLKHVRSFLAKLGVELRVLRLPSTLAINNNK